jgi:type I restriction enzyme M protein
LSQLIDKLRQQAKDEQATGDRYYWPIYNLDLKNPNAPEEESHDPDALLAKYQKLLGEIEQTQNQLRDELAAALGASLRERRVRVMNAQIILGELWAYC